MTKREIIYILIYGIPFSLSVLLGIFTGFRGHTHNPPAPFIIEVFVLPVCLILLLFNILFKRPLTFKTIRIHLIGLTINVLILLFTLSLALFNL